jgi:glycosyltransferase involved in cell wall biosynthesis
VHSVSVGQDLAAAARRVECPVIPIGIHASDFGDLANGKGWRKSRGIGDNELLVTSVARLAPSKDPLSFVRVAANITALRSDVRFVLVGDGSEKAAVLAAATEARLGDRLLVVGHEADIAAVLSASDVFLSTSTYEGFGIAILEAMASSTPVVATSVGGVPEVVASGTTGSLERAGDTAALTTAVLRLLDSEDMRLQMGSAGRARVVELFDAGMMARRYEDLYEAITSVT